MAYFLKECLEIPDLLNTPPDKLSGVRPGQDRHRGQYTGSRKNAQLRKFRYVEPYSGNQISPLCARFTDIAICLH